MIPSTGYVATPAVTFKMIGVVFFSVLFLQTDGNVIKFTDTNATNIDISNDAIETSTHFIIDNDVDSVINGNEKNISSDSIKILHLLSNGLNNEQPAEPLAKSFYGNSNINFPRRIGFGSRNENRNRPSNINNRNRASNINNRNRGHRGHFMIGSTTERSRISVGFPGEGSSAAVAFPNSPNDARWNAVELLRNEQESKDSQKNISCAIKDNLVLFEGQCQNLLQQSSCPARYWLVLDPVTARPYCKQLPCAPGSVGFQRRCVSLSDLNVCPRGQTLYLDVTGGAECDCDSDYFFHSRTQTCFAYHEQGFCNDGYFIEFSDEDPTNMNCVLNPCGSDNGYQSPNGQCYMKSWVGKCDGDDTPVIDEEGVAHCMEGKVDIRTGILFVPSFTDCPPGSRRDVLHDCSKIYGRAAQPRERSAYGTKPCRQGYARGPRGFCRKARAF